MECFKNSTLVGGHAGAWDGRRRRRRHGSSHTDKGRHVRHAGGPDGTGGSAGRPPRTRVRHRGQAAGRRRGEAARLLIDLPHLEVAEAGGYCRQSVLAIFGDRGNRHADVLLRLLRLHGPMTWMDRRDGLGLKTAADLEETVDVLVSVGARQGEGDPQGTRRAGRSRGPPRLSTNGGGNRPNCPKCGGNPSHLPATTKRGDVSREGARSIGPHFGLWDTLLGPLDTAKRVIRAAGWPSFWPVNPPYPPYRPSPCARQGTAWRGWTRDGRRLSVRPPGHQKYPAHRGPLARTTARRAPVLRSPCAHRRGCVCARPRDKAGHTRHRHNRARIVLCCVPRCPAFVLHGDPPSDFLGSCTPVAW